MTGLTKTTDLGYGLGHSNFCGQLFMSASCCVQVKPSKVIIQMHTACILIQTWVMAYIPSQDYFMSWINDIRFSSSCQFPIRIKLQGISVEFHCNYAQHCKYHWELCPLHKYQGIRKFAQVHKGKHLGPWTFIWITTKSATQVVQNRGVPLYMYVAWQPNLWP